MSYSINGMLSEFPGIQEKLGIINGGIVYAVFDYEAQNPDELNFKEGDRLVILRKGDEFEREWWWASLGENKEQGYVPRNLLGVSFVIYYILNLIIYCLNTLKYWLRHLPG